MKPSQAVSRRLEQFSKAFGLCSSQAGIYAACVTAKQGVKIHECQKEFEAMKQCIKQAMKKL